MDLRVEPVKGKAKRKVKEIYKASFVKEDRMAFWMMRMMSRMKSTDFLSFYDEDILCGFVYMATLDNLTFIMFFAVDENNRSKGYGSRILEEIQSIYPSNKIVLTIERCIEDADNIEQRLRRKKFYINNGYKDTKFLVELVNKTQEVLIKNGEFKSDEFVSFFKKYSNGTMKLKVWRADSDR